MKQETAQYQFLRRNSAVQWSSGVPMWDYYELIDGAWQVTSYEIELAFTNPTTRRLVFNDQPDEGYDS